MSARLDLRALGLPRGADDDEAYRQFSLAAGKALQAADEILRFDPHRLEVAFVGMFRTGKSSLLNALLGEAILPARHDPTTFVPTRLEYRATGFRAVVRFVAREVLDDERDGLRCALLVDSKADFELVEFHRALGTLGALQTDQDQQLVVDHARVNELRAAVRSGGLLPELLAEVATLPGTMLERDFDSAAALVEYMTPLVAPRDPEASPTGFGAIDHYLVSDVTLAGPFEGLRRFVPAGESEAAVAFVDTPGLGDRPHLDRRVYELLREVDCVCVHLGNAANVASTDEAVITELVKEGQCRKLLVTLGKFDLVREQPNSGDVDDHVRKAGRHVEAIVKCALREAGRPADYEEVPVVPVVALAALLRKQPTLESEAAPSYQGPRRARLLTDFPDEESDGIAELRRRIGALLDPTHRAEHVARRARDAVGRSTTELLRALEELIDDARTNCDLSPHGAERLRARLRSLTNFAGRIDSIGVFVDDVIATCRDYVELRGARSAPSDPGYPQVGACDFKCCGAAAPERWTYRQIARRACGGHEVVVESEYLALVRRERSERPECLDASCEEARLPDQQWCHRHASKRSGERGCESPAAGEGLCSHHAALRTKVAAETPIGFNAPRFISYAPDDCGAETESGYPCSRPPSAGRRRCWQHKRKRADGG